MQRILKIPSLSFDSVLVLDVTGSSVVGPWSRPTHKQIEDSNALALCW